MDSITLYRVDDIALAKLNQPNYYCIECQTRNTRNIRNTRNTRKMVILLQKQKNME